MRMTDSGVLLATQACAGLKMMPLISVTPISNAPGCARRSPSWRRKWRQASFGELSTQARKASIDRAPSPSVGGGVACATRIGSAVEKPKAEVLKNTSAGAGATSAGAAVGRARAVQASSSALRID